MTILTPGVGVSTQALHLANGHQRFGGVPPPPLQALKQLIFH